ncbi:MAG: hypothetical protein KGP14_00095 [Betaproteobacteria bacterium]|nr:hypothetical protein [Betaproteobacteria bacterium]
MKLRVLAPTLLLASLSLPVTAAQYACPELSSAKQVNACPTEDELKHTYHGFCSDDKKVYGGETDNCIRYKDYRAMKNTALWESADGLFDGYVSCDLPKAKLQSLKASGIKIEKQGSLTKVVCSYPNGVNFTYRTKGSCNVDDDTACTAKPGGCQATCD